MKLEDFTIDWHRCVYVDDVIDDALVAKLTPQILSFRRESAAPITLAINSPGGNLAAADALRALVGGPDQDGTRCRVITVVTHHAYSAAANLLALGDYAVALPHADLLFHDVRYGGLEDVTPDKARAAAKQLQTSNEEFALRLADRVFTRLIWNYFDLGTKVADDLENFSETAEAFRQIIGKCGLPSAQGIQFDIVGYGVSIFARLTKKNEGLIKSAMEHLGRWAQVMSLAERMPKYADGGKSGLLDGAKEIFDALASSSPKPFGRASNEVDISLLITLAAARLAATPMLASTTNFERALNEFALIKSINDPKHQRTATKLLVRHRHAFFTPAAAEALDGHDEDAKSKVRAEAEPIVRLAWLLCVLLCRELFRGDHELSPREALCLGLVDEVAGGSFVESQRDFIASGMYARAEEMAERQNQKA